ncbi:MAG: glycoside hydrolase family 95 protein, partial [Bacteroidales bacterium]|nr:glycoside hydrolase family 95 protein [Bacteroidales bacterium]
MKKNLLATAMALATIVTTATAQQHHRLWYARPASHWLEALPVGNSTLGAMVYGGTDTEEIQLNEETFWSGQPHDNNSHESLDVLPEVRRLIFAGKEYEASKLIDQHFVKGPHGMRFLPLGSLKLHFGHTDVTGYERALNLADATATTTYTCQGVKYERTVFASLADSVIIVHLEASKKGALSFEVGYHGQCPTLVKAQNRSQCPLTEGKNIQGAQLTATVQGVEKEGIDAGLTSECVADVRADGAVTALVNSIQVKGATEATIYLSAATNYVNFHDVSGDPSAKNKRRLASAETRRFKQLLARHIGQYSEQYNRVTLSLAKNQNSALETDKRVAAFEKDATDLDLVSLMMQYGRYLLISS